MRSKGSGLPRLKTGSVGSAEKRSTGPFFVSASPRLVSFSLPKSGPLYVENIPYNAPDNDQNKEYDIYPGRFGIKATAACAYIIYGSIYDNPCNVNDYKWCKIVVAYSIGKSEFETTECETADSASGTV